MEQTLKNLNNVVEEIDYGLIPSFNREILKKYELEVIAGLKDSSEYILNPGLNLDEAQQINYYLIMRGFKVLADTDDEGVSYKLIISRKK